VRRPRGTSVKIGVPCLFRRSSQHFSQPLGTEQNDQTNRSEKQDSQESRR
jgi:hypothetical protein